MNNEIIFESPKLKDDFQHFFKKTIINKSDLQSLHGVEFDNKDILTQHDLDILLKYIPHITFCNISFSNIVFRGNQEGRIVFKECSFNDCICENAVIVTNINGDKCYKNLSQKNTQIEIEIASIFDMLYIAKNSLQNERYSFKDENKWFSMSYSREEIIQIYSILMTIQEMIPDNISAFDKLLIVSIILSYNIRVDYRGIKTSEEYQHLSEEDKEKYFSLTHTYKGPFIYGIGVCSGFIKALSLVLETLNFKYKIVSSDNHVWIQLDLNSDGVWYNYDLTNLANFFVYPGNPFKKEIFLTSNQEIQNYADWFIFNSPHEDCTKSYQYSFETLRNHCNTILRCLFKYGLDINSNNIKPIEFKQSVNEHLSRLDR